VGLKAMITVMSATPTVMSTALMKPNAPRCG
jgi:hypothetical protein